MTKSIITAAMLILTTTTVATEKPNSSQKNSFCQSMAHMVEGFAKARDEGASESEVTQYVNKQDYSEIKTTMAHGAIDEVYTYPKLPPVDSANEFYTRCMNTL